MILLCSPVPPSLQICMMTIDRPETTAEPPPLNLSLESTLQDLSLDDYQIEITHLGIVVVNAFNQNPALPGVILSDAGSFVGIISRRRFLELMSRPYGLELFSKRSLKVLSQFAQTNSLLFSGTTSIVAAARQSLQRSPELLYEPIVIQIDTQTYRLLDVHQLLVASSHIHELTTNLLNEQTQAQLIQTEKMASLGQMVAGIAHEILNPVNFISGNIDYLANYGEDLIDILNAYESEFPQSSKRLDKLKEEIECEFIVKDFPKIIASMKMGSERLRAIIGALRTFSHMDEMKKRPVDLHECLENTLLILTNRFKNSVQMIKHYGEVPPVYGYAGQLSQVLMNLIGNAIDALTEMSDSHLQTTWKPTIEITTRVCLKEAPSGEGTRWAGIYIADNGPGIPPEIQARIFEMFFTTKAVGKGTGLGLAISHQIVTEKHGGQINLRSQPGEGTTFEVLLPLGN